MKCAIFAIVALLGIGLSHAEPYYTDGPGDLLLVLNVDGSLESKFGFQAGAVLDGITLSSYQEFGQDEYRIQVPFSSYAYTASQGGRPAGAAWDAIGVPAGASYFYLPETTSGPGSATDIGAPAFGFSAASLDPAKWSNLSIFMDGTPANDFGGQFSLYTGGATPQFSMIGADGADETDKITLAPGTTARYNWAFSEEGNYYVNFRIVGTYEGELKEGAATYFITVVPEPGSAIMLGSVAIFGFAKRQRKFS